jgi:hypothetical protein
MSPARTSRERGERARRRELKREMERLAEHARRRAAEGLAALDGAVVLEARVIGDKVIIDDGGDAK